MNTHEEHIEWIFAPSLWTANNKHRIVRFAGLVLQILWLVPGCFLFLFAEIWVGLVGLWRGPESE